MNTFVSRIMLVLTVGGLIGLSCKQTPNRAPIITSLDLPDSVNATVDATFSCTASDSDGDPLAYDWTCSTGLLQSKTGTAVEWTAPESSGVATITVTVTDTCGASDTSSGTVIVNPVTAIIVDWHGAVAAGDIGLWTSSILAGYTVSGSFSAVGQDITFLMLDSSNYESWRFAQPYDALVKVEKSAGSDFSTVVPTNGVYRFVLDNTYNATADTSVHLFVERTSP
jgi:hypothetical protein